MMHDEQNGSGMSFTQKYQKLWEEDMHQLMVRDMDKTLHELQTEEDIHKKFTDCKLQELQTRKELSIKSIETVYQYKRTVLFLNRNKSNFEQQLRKIQKEEDTEKITLSMDIACERKKIQEQYKKIKIDIAQQFEIKLKQHTDFRTTARSHWSLLQKDEERCKNHEIAKVDKISKYHNDRNTNVLLLIGALVVSFSLGSMWSLHRS